MSMIRFSARYNALIDDKGRVVLPSPLKKTMGNLADEPLVIEKDIYKNCLNIYPEKYWNQRIEAIERQLNPFDEKDDDLLAELYENFTTVTMASNGRINIPADFMNHAAIKREVVFAGKGKSIRLWDEQLYLQDKAKGRPLRDAFRDRLGNNSVNSDQ
jgi:MraZ protein